MSGERVSVQGFEQSTAPLVGAGPLRPTTTVQRSTNPAVAELTEPTSRGFDADLTGARVNRIEQGAGSADPSTGDAFTNVDDISSSTSRSPMDSAPVHSLLTRALSRVAPQPRYARRIEPAVPSVERLMDRGADFPLAPVQRVAVATPVESPAPSGDSTSAVVQREGFDSVSSEVGGPSSRAPSPADAGSAVSTVGSASGSVYGGHQAAETDMDELAGKLYDKIRTRLKSELLVDRERAGFLTDLR